MPDNGTNYENHTGRFIGSVIIKKELETYKDVGKGHSNAVEIGFVIDKAFWGQGYGTEIAIVAKKYIKHVIGAGVAITEEEPQPAEIVATAHPDNVASRAILNKTLKNQEPDSIIKFGGNPRFLFFKPLKLNALIDLERSMVPQSSGCLS